MGSRTNSPGLSSMANILRGGQSPSTLGKVRREDRPHLGFSSREGWNYSSSHEAITCSRTLDPRSRVSCFQL